MPAPCVPAANVKSEPIFVPKMSVGSSTLIVLVAFSLPTVSSIFTVAARSGAVQTSFVLLAPVAGLPLLAFQVPAALPVKVTSSPTPTVSRVLGLPSGALKVVSELIAGGAAGGDLSPVATGPDAAGSALGTASAGAVGAAAVGTASA